MKHLSAKKFWRIAAVVLAVELSGVAAVYFWPQLFPSAYVSDTYRKYADQPGIQASFVKNYYLNDSVAVDVTLLRATDDSAWALLARDFNILPVPEELNSIYNPAASELWSAPKGAYDQPMDSDMSKNDAVAIVRELRQICIFDIQSPTQLQAVLSYHFNNNITLKK